MESQYHSIDPEDPQPRDKRTTPLRSSWAIPSAVIVTALVALGVFVSQAERNGSLELAPHTVNRQGLGAVGLKRPSTIQPAFSPNLHSQLGRIRGHHAVRAMPIEEQKERAKEMIKYYRIKGLQRTEENRQIFGWTPNNEILNGRWVMMGLALGLLTEYATGVNFIDQIKLMLSYTGVIDFE